MFNNIGPFHGGKSVRLGRRGAKRDAEASTLPSDSAAAAEDGSGEHHNAPGGPICPTEGRALFAARGVARCLKWPALRRNALLSGGKNRFGETTRYY